MWAKKWLLNRDAKSVYGNIIAELRLDDAENYRRYLRVNTATFEVSYYHNFPFISCVMKQCGPFPKI